ncbi:MAG: hypothetical protein MJ137_02700 [Clostridia bacterium]|nr:hypothetical protein [Clostridia bacterium]
MKPKRLLAAVDIGGTKTAGLVFDENGRVYHALRDRGITPVDASLGDCLEHYKSVLARLIDAAEKAGGKLQSTYCSIATIEHYTPVVTDTLREEFGDRTGVLRAEPDGMCLISGMLGHSDGCAMICGTGSSLYVRSGDEFFRVGGWGHYIDSCASGFVLGRLAIRAALREYDGRDPHTALTELINKKCGRPIQDDYDRIYALGRPYVASYAGCVFEARRMGDAAASEIFESCSSDLAELVTTACRRTGKLLTVILNGGIFSHYPEYAEAVRSKCPAGTEIISGDVPPVYGCTVEAMYSLGLKCGEDFKAAVISGLTESGLV